MSQPPTPPAPGQPEARLNLVSFDFGTTASTATAFTQLEGAIRPMDPEHVRIVRGELIDLIKSTWPEEELRPLFVAEARQRLHEKVGEDIDRGIGPEAGARNGNGQAETELDQLLRWLGEESPVGNAREDFIGPVETRVLDEVWMTLAEFVGPHEFQRWRNLKLHDILHKALRQPAFIQNNLVSVPFEGRSTTQVVSILMVENADIDKARLTDVASGKNALSFRGLKRRVPRPVPLPAALNRPGEDSDVLVGRAYEFLAEKVTAYAAAELNAPGHRLSTVIVTYPTTSPPAVRERLRALVGGKLGVDPPVMRFDEGVAALMFVLMRDFGGDDEAGIETFRAKSRLVGSGHWRQNLLVLDIGGGTTDIALTRLDLRNATPGVDNWARRLLPSGPDGAVEGGPRTRGRVYFLEPQVLGSTGHQQYGGDLLTLSVFYWIKAGIADAVRDAVAGHPDEAEVLRGWPAMVTGARPSLARAVADYQEPGPGPRDVVAYLRNVLPTRNGTRPSGGEPYSQQLEPAFLQLWRIAENAKLALSGAERVPFNLAGSELKDLVALLTSAAWKPQLDALVAGGQVLTFTVEDFDRLARAVISPSVAMAVDLARRLLADQQGELLDGIALTGRAAGIPLVREVMLERLAEVFGDRNRGGRPMAWNPALVTAEHDHPKEAASIGACWAHAKQQNTQKGLRAIAEGEQYQSGRDQLVINVDNMVVNLPCRFGLGAASHTPLDLLAHGHPLEFSDARGKRFARTKWIPAHPDIRLLRFTDQQRYIQWGHYNIESRLGLTIPEGLRFQIEIDDELIPTLHLCMGPAPRFGLDGSGIPLDHWLPRGCLDGSRLLTSLPWDICVRNVDEITGEESWQAVIDADRTITGASFPFDFVPLSAGRASAAAPLVPARISRQLPRPVPAGQTGKFEYAFAGIIPGEDAPRWKETVPTTQLQRPGNPAPDWQGAPHWAVLDAFGVLHLPEPGYPRYQRAADLTMMLGEMGCVFSTAMEPPQPDMRADWDPFTGEH